MADPFSAIGCVLGMLSSLITISQPVIKILDDVKYASGDIQCLSRDIRAFFSVGRFLDIALREQDVQYVIKIGMDRFFSGFAVRKNRFNITETF